MKNNVELDKKNFKVLIVDDVPGNLKVLTDILKGDGYNVRPVTNGMLALQVASNEKPDLILLDILMPDMDGYEVCHRLKEDQNLNDIPVIFISALNETNDIVKALNSGGADYITKPFKSEEVTARVATHIKIYQQRKELQELNATKDKFFSIIAHDLRGPFTSFLGYTRMMVEDVPSLNLDEIQNMTGILNKSAVNLYSLLENLLEWARMQRGITRFIPESFLLTDKISNCMELTDDAARKKEIETDINIPGHLEVFADVRMFETVIRNLITNAIKFTPRGGRVTVSARNADLDLVEISIHDTGIGINKDMIGKLFHLDEQTGRKGTEGEPTVGLGLIICKDFIEKNNGKIWVDSEVGKGATFYFTVPKSQE